MEENTEDSRGNIEVSKEDVVDASEVGINPEDLLQGSIMKEEYEEFPYDLPDFDVMCEDFDIEKAYEKESSFLLREVRKTIMEKLSAYLQLFETFMNPSSPPMFVFNFLRNIGEKDRELIKKIYKDLSKYQLWSVKLDTIYDEKSEAEYIKFSFDEWQKLKQEIYDLVDRLEKENSDEKDSVKNGYVN